VRQVLGYTGMLIRAFVRDFTGLFFSLFLPLGFMLIFGALNFGAATAVDVGIVDQAQNPASFSFVDALDQVDAFDITKGTLDEERAALEAGDRDMVVVLPSDFHISPAVAGGARSTVTVLAHGARGQEVAIGSAIVDQIVTRFSFAVTGSAPVMDVRTERVSAHDLGYVDFLMPGIVGMNVMQLAIFSVGFGLVIEKQRGVLRRIMATPMPPIRFLASHVLMRLILAFLQVLILIGVAVLLFKVTIVGSILTMLLLTTLGSVMFLTFGFALAGWATSDNQVAPIANLITLPQLFLSGVFFSRDAAPAAIRPVTDLLPLTFLNDALREVSTEGATLLDVSGDVLGMLVWTIVGFLIALRLFRFQT
jgi:ABC-2 type transport system permease protein